MITVKEDDFCGNYTVTEHKIGSQKYSFNVDWVPKGKREWLDEVVGDYLEMAYAAGKLDKEQEVKEKITALRESMGIFS